jgi:hypothetical protein
MDSGHHQRRHVSYDGMRAANAAPTSDRALLNRFVSPA